MKVFRALCPLVLTVCLATAIDLVHRTAAYHDTNLLHRQRLLLASVGDVSSPDVSLDGACAADIVQHCKHLLRKSSAAAANAHPETANSGAAATKSASGADALPKITVQVKAPAAGIATASAVKDATAKDTAASAAADKTDASKEPASGNASASSGEAAAAAPTKTAESGATKTVAAATNSGTANAGGGDASTGSAAAAAVTSTSGSDGAAVAAVKTTDVASAGDGAAAAQTTQKQPQAAGQAEAASSTSVATSAAAGSTAVGTAAADATTTTQQTEQQQTQVQAQAHRRVLLADASASAAGSGAVAAVAAAAAGKAVLAEVKTLEAHKDDLGRALELLGLRSSLRAGGMATASAPIARCLQGVMHASEMSISPNIPHVADECKAEVRSVLIQRASDVRYDPPLLAACSHDIVAHCEDVGADTTAVMGCLKAAKPQLLPLCRMSVTVRQAAAAEDLSLDPDLHRQCGAEREKLCLQAGWGNGAAQACLLGHLRGSLPQVFSEIIFPVSGSVAAKAAAAAASEAAVELSANCSAALVQRLIEEGEDIRFNYRLSAACAGDKQVLCRDVRPGGAAVLRCLEDHLDSPLMQEECRETLHEERLLRSLDVRLDHTFATSCAADVRALCGQEVSGQLEASPAEVPFGLWSPFECLRGHLDMVRDPTCRRHVYDGVISSYKDNRLDAGLVRGCNNEIAMFCAPHPARALECLQEKVDQFSRDDSPAVLKGKISDTCLAVVLERRQQAATDLAFLPDLMEACAREHASLCTAPGMEGVRALDCLADHRNTPDFSDRCGEALRDYLAEAARDIRTMAGLQEDCAEEIQTLCRGVQPGEGRVVSCLRDQRANITGEQCRRQVMRLLGFVVEDHRLDAKLTAACTSDVQKYCGGVEAGEGQVHDCLRRSFDHLSPECRAAEEEVERLEHEDVRLNPRLMRECPVAVRSFCSDVPPGDARVIRCLQSNMDKGHFPPACRQALLQLTDRAAVKYSLNFRLRQECEEDTQRLCPKAVDELGDSRKAATGTGGAHNEETTLACLARQSAELASGCRSELQALVKLSLNRYRVGMPLTSQCDGDVMQRCQVDQMAAPFLQSGYVLGCLAKHAAQLHKPCWELVSTMDDGQFKRAVAAETIASQEAVVDEKVLRQVAADVRRELEPRLYSSVHEQINRKTVLVARNMTGALVMSIAPKVNALMHTTLSLLMLTGVGLLGALLAWRKFMARGGNLLVVRKDGRV